MLHFDPETGLYVDPTDKVREDVRTDWTAAFAGDGRPPLDTAPETPAGQLIDSEAAIISEKDSQVLWLSNQFNPLTAEGVWQEALGKIYFITRKVAESSAVTCRCAGLSGTVIPAGSLVRDDEGRILYSTAQTTIPESGQVSVMFVLSETGPLAIGAETVNKIVTVIPGWDTVTNPTAGVLGRHAETQKEFETRRFNSVAKNAHGSLAAIYAEIADIPGVLDLMVLENVTNEPIEKWGVTIPGHSVFIAVYGGDDAAIAEAIYRKKDAGCGTAGNTTVTYTDNALGAYPGGLSYSYLIERPATLSFRIRVLLRPTQDTTVEAMEKARQAIYDSFNGLDGSDRVRIASVVYASRFYGPVYSSGIQDLVSIKIAAPAGSSWLDEISVRADQIPVLSIDDIYVEIEG